MPAAVIPLPVNEIATICRRHEVGELALFGSVARGDAGPESDVDFLVDFLPEAKPGLLDLAALGRELSELLGRRVDVAIKRALKPKVRDGVLADAQLVYRA